jgi:alginate O-acetyltransferase complex protein AlgI
MLFPTAQFAVFFAVLMLFHRLVPSSWRTGLLLGASLLFYTLWYPAYLVLLLGDIGVNFLLLRGIVGGRRPRFFLAVSILLTLGLLAFFKYAAFLVGSAAPFLEAGFGWSPPLPEIFLPLGISFYSFQIVALAIDAYRDPKRGLPPLSRYALFVSFFPQLIAGPILRGPELLPQLAVGGQQTPERRRRGAWLIGSGLVKKVVFADFLLSEYVDTVFGSAGVASAAFHWVAMYAFAFQLYFDFSGYTDMARGLALLLGFELPFNFREPYLSRNPSEFWQRWHMTLSRWLRDYLYIPLGGNRRALARTLANLLVTMVLGGLWHGAAWTYVIWGALCGAILIVHRLVGGRGAAEAPLAVRQLPSVLLHFTAFSLTLVFFRAESAGEAVDFLGAMFQGGQVSGWPVAQSGVVALCILFHGLERFARPRLPGWRASVQRRPWGPALEGAVLGVIFGLAVAASGVGGEFIYFQF